MSFTELYLLIHGWDIIVGLLLGVFIFGVFVWAVLVDIINAIKECFSKARRRFKKKDMDK